jgi:hypothetical protein
VATAALTIAPASFAGAAQQRPVASTAVGIRWIISADTGIHPSVAGHTQFAQALEQIVLANDLVPPLPPARPGRGHSAYALTPARDQPY